MDFATCWPREVGGRCNDYIDAGELRVGREVLSKYTRSIIRPAAGQDMGDMRPPLGSL